MSVNKAKALADNVADDSAREALLVLCAALDSALKEINQLKQKVNYIEVNYNPR